MRNEIITYGQNYGLTQGIKVFVKSAKACSADVTVLGLNLKADVIDFLKENGVNYVDVEPLAIKCNVDTKLSPYTLKVIFFYLYLKKWCNADNVFLCDFTDIYFQGDIFNYQPAKATVFTEGETIANCPTNSTWINICYNADIFGLLRRHEIINGGAILGLANHCKDLLNEMCLDSAVVISKIGNYQNIDQAILNKVVRFDEPNYNIFGPQSVLNMAHQNQKMKIRIVYNNIVADEMIPLVIHQYDVNKDVEAFINDKSGK